MGFWIEAKLLLQHVPKIFHFRKVAAVVIFKHAFEDIYVEKGSNL